LISILQATARAAREMLPNAQGSRIGSIYEPIRLPNILTVDNQRTVEGF
jgi:hypothetical protein